MSNQLMELKQTIENQLEIVIQMEAMKSEVEQMTNDIKKDVQELRDSIKLNRSECAEIQSEVAKKSWELTSEFFKRKVSDDLFMAKLGHFRSIIYKRLKETFNVSTYFDIRRVDFMAAKTVIDIVALNNLKNYQLRLTARQKEIAEMNGDNFTPISFDI